MECNHFDGTMIDNSKHHFTVHFKCKLSGKSWDLTNSYGPAHNEGRADFLQWMENLDTTNMTYWMIIVDFNLIRAPSYRNIQGGDPNNIMDFNNVLHYHDLEDIPLKGPCHAR
jgi:hypothetical protein